jgi:hypothetical protein
MKVVRQGAPTLHVTNEQGHFWRRILSNSSTVEAQRPGNGTPNPAPRAFRTYPTSRHYPCHLLLQHYVLTIQPFWGRHTNGCTAMQSLQTPPPRFALPPFNLRIIAYALIDARLVPGCRSGVNHIRRSNRSSIKREGQTQIWSSSAAVGGEHALRGRGCQISTAFRTLDRMSVPFMLPQNKTF